jgi:hypothetical protein
MGPISGTTAERTLDHSSRSFIVAYEESHSHRSVSHGHHFTITDRTLRSSRRTAAEPSEPILLFFD